MTYERLRQRGHIGKLELKNRTVMPPMGTGYAQENGEASDEIIKFYEERAKGGIGLIITEITRIDDETGIGMANQLAATKPMHIRKLSYLADAVHKYDSKIFLQLHHPGRQTPKKLLNGLDPVAPSAIPCKIVGDMPRALTTEEVEEMGKKFVRGAVIAKTAGMDGVELHAAHGYLLDQFLSPYTNKRTDKYGGNFTNRVRLLTEIILGIRMACGKDFPVSVRISGDEFIEGGLRLEDTVKLARYLESLGVHAMNVSCGTYESGVTIIEPAQLQEGWKKHLAKTIKENISIPVIAVNTVKHPEFAEALLEEGVSDFVALGRSTLTDPEWVNKALDSREEEITKCIGCLHCFKTAGQGKAVECAVNPRLGREFMFDEEKLNKNGNGRTVVVIGGGPSGMESARLLAKRGFKVVLFEKQEKLGGKIILASKGAYKDLLGEFIDTQIAKLNKEGVEVRLKEEATIEKIKALDPYGVVIARGGLDIVPNIEGIHGDNVYSYDEILLDKVDLKGKKVAVIGGGETGLETAEHMAPASEVHVIEMRPSYGDSMYRSVLMLMEKRFEEKSVKVHTNTGLEAIKEDKIILKDMKTSKLFDMDLDAVVIAIGVRTDRAFNEEIRNNFENVISLGDSSKPGNMASALREANDKSFVF